MSLSVLLRNAMKAPLRGVSPLVVAVAQQQRRGLKQSSVCDESCEKLPVESYFGCNVFNEAKQAQMLPKAVFEEIQNCKSRNTPVSLASAEAFASALKTWAQERGVTHYAHWFVPIGGRIGVKHDVFFKCFGKHGLSEFKGKTLIRGEPDGSSFPNGGLRKTHTARAHTVWDPSSSPFVVDHGTGATLFIPTVMFTWAGNSIDEKLPLVRSRKAIQDNVLHLLDVIGEKGHSGVHAESGLEQEFFLIDRQYFLGRKDLIFTGRTLHGKAPPKGQEMEDQYFGEISERMVRAINEFEIELFKLGISMSTRHREVAPGQYEVAPLFASAGEAADQNLLLMSTITRVVRKHGIEVLFHEKPFAGVNGSGKHNNWSIGTNLIPTLFNPGDHPASNHLFNLFVATTLKMVHKHGDLLRIAIATPGNDHRLGANEAPPAIISVFLGTETLDTLKQYIYGTVPPQFVPHYDLGCTNLPPIARERTDRNRTSPFAYTGNKFEFRAVGSSQTLHFTNTVLNTIMADAVHEVTAEIELKKKAGLSIEAAVKETIRETYEKHEKIVFHGNGYSDEWRVEAEKRGLPNYPNAVDSFDHLTSTKNETLFATMGVFSKDELHARQHVMYEQYTNTIQVEAKCLIEIARTVAIPAAVDYLNSLTNINSAESLRASLNEHITGCLADVSKLESTLATIKASGDHYKAAHIARDLAGLVNLSRRHVDGIEALVPASSWSIPTYADMLFDQN